MEELKQIFQSIVSQANARTVYGDPIQAGAKTILPVATIRYCFGGGSGRSKNDNQQGGGGGGGVIGTPVGVVEITEERTRFIPIDLNGKLAIAAGIGFALGLLVARRR